MYVGETLKVQSLWNAFNMKSVLQTHISKRHFLISLLRLCVKEWMQMKEYECSISEMAFKLNANTHCKHNKGSFPDILSLQVKPLKCCLWHLRWNQFCCRTLPILQKDIFWYPYFDSGWRNVCRWNPITAVFVKWHLRWNQFCNHTCLFPK